MSRRTALGATRATARVLTATALGLVLGLMSMSLTQANHPTDGLKHYADSYHEEYSWGTSATGTWLRDAF